MNSNLRFLAAMPLFLSSCLFATLPVDNPIETYYGAGAYSWTGEIKWDQTFNVTSYGAIADDDLDDLAAINAAVDAAHAAGGGVVYFPEGVWNVSDDLVIRDGVVLRGAAPVTPAASPIHERGDGSFLSAPAQLDGYQPLSRLQFPPYVPTFTGSGTPNDTAFKVITVEDEVTTSNWGLVHLDLDHVRIRNYQDVWLTGPFELADRATVFNPAHNARNIVIFGNRGNHMAAPDPRVPSGSQHAWQRFTARGSSNIALMAYENILVANNRLNDNITDDFAMPGYLLSTGVLPNKPADKDIMFRYTNNYGINLNRVYANPSPSPTSLTPDTFPEAFRKGMVARDNWLYSTARVGYHVTGQDAVIINNVKVDDPDKFSAVMPTGTRQAAGSDTNENRGVDFSGFNVTVSGNDLDIYSHFTYLSSSTINGSVDGEAILNQAHTTAIVRGALIENNYVKGYIGIYKTGDSENITIRQNRIRPGSFTRQNIYENIYVVADINSSPNQYLRDVLIEENWLTSLDDMKVYGTGGISNVGIRNNVGGNLLSYSDGIQLSGNGFVSTSLKTVDFPYNPRPTVTLSGLADGSTVAPGGSVELTAAVDHAVPVASVEFWSNGSKLGEDLSEPYTLLVEDLTDGTRHNVYAKAIDTNGRSNWSMLSIAFTVAGSGGLVAPSGIAIEIVGGDSQVTFQGESSLLYVLEYSPDLATWSDVDGPVPGSAGSTTLTHSGGAPAPGSSSFYRISYSAP
jgi:hypothetical protein